MGFSFHDCKQLSLDESLVVCTESLWFLKRVDERGKRAGGFFCDAIRNASACMQDLFTLTVGEKGKGRRHPG